MECIACHKWLPEHSRFCQRCGEQQLALFTAGARGIRVAEPVAHRSDLRLEQATPTARDVMLERMIPRVIVMIGSLFLAALAFIIWMNHSERASSLANKTTQVSMTNEQAKAQPTRTSESARSGHPAMSEAANEEASEDADHQTKSDADDEPGGERDSDKGSHGLLAIAPVSPPPPPPDITLLSAAAAVPPDKYLYYEFDIARGYSSSSRVRGSFSAQGGAAEDIQVSITDAAGLTNLARGHQYKGWYRSGRSKDDQIDLRLAPGHYYVVLDNRGSTVSNKVKLNLRLVRDDD